VEIIQKAANIDNQGQEAYDKLIAFQNRNLGLEIVGRL
jgi:hypothetical protein